MKNSWIVSLAAGFLSLSMGGAFAATTLLSDNFDDNNTTSTPGGANWHFYNSNAAGTVWTTTTDTTLDPTGKVFLNNGAGTSNTVAMASFAPVTLTDGTNLQVSFSIRDATTPLAGNFGVGVYNNNGAGLSGNYLGVANPLASESNYTATKLWLATSSGTSLHGTTTPTDNTVVNDNNVHAVIFTITDTAGTINLDISYDGVDVGPVAFTSPPTLTLDTLALTLAGANSIRIDNMLVTTTAAVPEPSVVAALAFGLGLIVLIRRPNLRKLC